MKTKKIKRDPRKIPRFLQQAGKKALLLLAGTALACAALEGYLRLKWPFINKEFLSYSHPQAGNIRQPNAQMRWTNPHSEFFVVEKVNRLGFLDREPLSPEQRGTGCHIAFIGDSFVEAKEVPITNKFHIQLEQLAAQELPDLNITTSAFGITSTGQINQLPFYDVFARPLRPCVLVLVFVINDFPDNHPVLQSLNLGGVDPDHNPFTAAKRNEDGTFELRDPDRKFREHRLPRLPTSWTSRMRIYSAQKSYLAKWLHFKLSLWEYVYGRAGKNPELNMWVNHLSQRPRYNSLAKEWPYPATISSVFEYKDLPPIFEEALEFTAFGLDQFKERADRDGIPLLILSTYTMGTQGDGRFDRMRAMAEERGIPVIDQTDYICRQGKDIEDARWALDNHWNLAGHQWAAEALLEYLKENPHICRAQSNRVEQADAQED